MNGFISIDLQVDTDILDAVAEEIQTAPKRIRDELNRSLRPLKRQFLVRLRTEPGPPKYPLRWKSAKQRRYVMAKLRRENNLPYRRTHKLVDSFDVVLRYTREGEGEFVLENSDPKARYVIGDDQQPFHIDTGWPAIADDAVQLEDELSNLLIDRYLTLALRFAGVR